MTYGTGIPEGPDGGEAGREDPLDAALRLALIPGVGPRTRQSLLRHFGSPKEVLRATCETHRIRILGESDADFPRMLREIADPPGVLFVHGELREADGLAMAIVGTRHATGYGREQAERLAAGLARAGFTVISGLARGIDAQAHRGALQAGGRTLAVLGGGLLNLYPPEHAELARRIAQQGAVISESPPYQPPQSGAFPQRNRLISGMSLGVVVVEAAERSGALITARHAMEQGRDVFAVPGRVDSRASRGCHQLLRDGARLVESVDDILDELGPLVETTRIDERRRIRHPAELQLNEQEQAVLQAVGEDPTDIDLVIHRSRLPTHRALATISVLEMRHLLQRISGNRLARR